MINWLKRLFGGSDSSDASTSEAPEPATAPEPPSMPAQPAAPHETPVEPASGAGDEPV